jgi:exosortase/archaeosortase family protein
MFLCAGLLLVARDGRVGSALAPAATLTARVAAAVLERTGVAVSRDETVLREAGGFAYEIDASCTGLPLVVLVSAGMLAWGGLRWRAVAGAVVAGALLLGLNQVRLVHLFLVGAYRPDAFGLVHDVVWRLALSVAALAIWLGWWWWVREGEERSAELLA